MCTAFSIFTRMFNLLRKMKLWEETLDLKTEVIRESDLLEVISTV